MITLNSTAISLKALRITASLELAGQDASGQSSNTDSAETGAKAKMLAVTGFIPFSDVLQLGNLFKLAEALEGGARTIYRISNKTAEALGIKQVKFASSIEAVEQETTRQWSVTFHLQEHRSVPQKVEEREPKPKAAQQGSTEQASQGAQADAEAPPPGTEVELTGFAAFLKGVDNALAPEEETA